MYTNPSPFRSTAVRRYSARSDSSPVALRGVSLRRIAGLWLLLALCIAAGCTAGYALIRLLPA
jgi:hypothetical protein